MKPLITILLASTIWSATAAEFGFEGGVSRVAPSIKTATRAAFKAEGYVEHKGEVTGAAFWTTTFPLVAEVDGGNIGSTNFGLVVTPETIEFDAGGMCVWWIHGNVLTFNRVAKPTPEEVAQALFFFLAVLE